MPTTFETEQKDFDRYINMIKNDKLSVDDKSFFLIAVQYLSSKYDLELDEEMQISVNNNKNYMNKRKGKLKTIRKNALKKEKIVC
jgi:hypothetical protein